MDAIEANRALPPFTITDISGTKWTLASLKNKTTLVNLWATWCEPCRKELPLLQKLYDRVKDRKDIAVITFNTDDNPGLIDPFLKENHYTFPVLPARDYVDSIVPSLAIPRNWIVNKQGVLASVTIGFNPSAGDAWVDQTLQSLENPDTTDFLNRTLAKLDPEFAKQPEPKTVEPRTSETNPESAIERPLVALNAPLPAFHLTDLAGKTWTDTDLHGTTTLINVWATWCGPCRNELPLVQALYDRLKDRSDIRVLTFNIDQNQDAVQPFLDKYHFNFPVVDARTYARSVLLRVSIPRTWVVDKKGIVKDSSTGYSSSLARGWVDRTLKSMEKLQHGRD
ncbi:MAG TPA: TlpA disulfide reductase family protein [Bryobacteraceae bacterium]